MFRQLILITVIITFGFGCYGIGPARAADSPAVGSAPPSLESVAWAGQGTNFESLKGKTVLVITYVTWCPICNGWSKDALSGLSKAIGDKPVIVLAISTDTSPAKSQLYMQQRGVVGPNVLYGYDPTIAKRFGFTNEFFNYAIIGPDSKVAGSGDVGSHWDSNGGKDYVMVKEIASRKDLGQFRFVTRDMSETLKELVFPMELGILPSAGNSTDLKQSLKAEDRREFDKMVKHFLDEQLADATRLAEGDASEKMSAFDIATYLFGSFKSTEQGKKAKKILTDLNKDKDLKKELTAKRLYEDSMKQAEGDTALRTELLRTLKKKFPGTHYAKVADSFAEDGMKAK